MAKNMDKHKKVFTDVEGLLKNAVDVHTSHPIKNFKGLTSDVLDANAVKARMEKCQAKNICFVSLKALGEEVGVLNHAFGAVSVLPMYVK